MGVHVHMGTLDGGLTPICNHCGIALCWDISEDEYKQDQLFWDDWICRDCTPDKQPMTRERYYKSQDKRS